MRQSIVTKYHGPSNVRGSRVSATSASGHRIMIEWDAAADTDTNHKIACARLAEKLNWHGAWACGSLPNGCVFVNLDGDQFNVRDQQRAAA